MSKVGVLIVGVLEVNPELDPFRALFSRVKVIKRLTGEGRFSYIVVPVFVFLL